MKTGPVPLCLSPRFAFPQHSLLPSVFPNAAVISSNAGSIGSDSMFRKPTYLAAAVLLGCGAFACLAVEIGKTHEEQSESRQNAVDHHPGDRVKQDEHTAMLDL